MCLTPNTHTHTLMRLTVCAAQVNRAGFLELWLLRNDLVAEAALATADAEFDALQRDGVVDVGVVSAAIGA